MKYTVLSLIMLFLVSCSGVQDQTSTPAQIETASPVVTETQPVVHKTPTDVVESTTIPVPTVYDFPSWMKNPKTAILAALFRDDLEQARKIYFFNATTGEKFEMNPTMPFGGFFWYDNMNFGLLAKDLNIAYEFNLQTGQIHTESISQQSARLLDKDWVNGLVMFKESTEEFVFDKTRFSNTSKNKSFAAEWVDSQKNVVV